MNYKESVRWLFDLINYETTNVSSNETDGTPPLARRFDLSRVHKILESLGSPHHTGLIVHIAGTKGKGTTAALLYSVLTANGYNTGLFTSPHLHSIRERISINGEKLTQAEFADLAVSVRGIVQPHNDNHPNDKITTFEALTCMAFLAFKRSAVDIQIIETGLGGRLDSTNVVDSSIVGITSISEDHMEILGTTLVEIAKEKFGIIKQSVDVVSAPQDATIVPLLELICDEKKASLTLVGKNLSVAKSAGSMLGQEFRVWGDIQGRPVDHDLRTNLLAEYQLENAAVAVGILEKIRDRGYPVAYDKILLGFNNVDWPGRFEIIKETPLVIADGAHNPYSAMRLVETIATDFPNRPVQMVVGLSKDKDASAIARELSPIAKGIVVTKSNHARSMEPEIVEDAFWETGIPVRTEPTVNDAIDRAIIQTPKDGIVVITGSLFVVAEAREYVLGIEPERIMES